MTGGSQGDRGSSPLAAGDPSLHTRAPTVDFLEANASAKHALVEKMAKSWLTKSK